MKRQVIFDEINITPLTDIFLVLLIIMMVVAPMLDYSGIKLAVPTVEPSAEVKEDPKVIKITINAQNQFTVDGQAETASDLTRAIKPLIQQKPDGVIIQVNGQASHEAMAHAMDAAQTAGVTKVAVVEAEAGAAGEAAAEEAF